MRWQECKEELNGSIMKKVMDLSTIQVAKIFFVHYSAIKQDGYKTLSEGQIVEFDLIETAKGLQAINVLAESNVKA